MSARRTSWKYLLLAFLLGAGIGALLTYFALNAGVRLLGSTWIVPLLLFLLGVLVLVLAWQVRKYARGELKGLDLRRAFNTLVLAKALSLAGCALSGWYLAQILIVFPHRDAPYFFQIIIECSFALGASIFDVVAGIISEGWCQLPPNKGPEHPEVKAAKKIAASTGAENASTVKRK